MFTYTSQTLYLADAEQECPSNIDTALWELMQSTDNDELIPIGITLSAVDDEALMQAVKAKTGLDPEVYMDDTRFEKEVSSKITYMLEKKLGYEEAHRVGNGEELMNDPLSVQTTEAIKSVFSNELKGLSLDSEQIVRFVETDRSLSVVDYTILAVQKNFQTEKNRIVRSEQSANVDAFITECVNARDNEVVYAGRYTSSLYLKASKDDIMYYSQMSEVENIYFADLSVKTSPTLSHIPSQVRAIAAGSRVSFNARTYEGIASGANVFITQATDAAKLLTALDALADHGVDVINISMGISGYTTYTYVDSEVERVWLTL